MAARAELVEYRVMFASLGAVCSVLVNLLAVAANWIEDLCKRNHLRLLQGLEVNSNDLAIILAMTEMEP